MRKITMIRSFFLMILLTTLVLLGGCSNSAIETDLDTSDSLEIQVVEPHIEKVGIEMTEDPFIPLTGITVQIGDYTARTDEEGTAMFNNLAAGDYELSIAAPGYEAFTKTVQLKDKQETFSAYMYTTGSAVINPKEATFNKLDPADVETEIDWQETEELQAIYRQLDENNYQVYNQEDNMQATTDIFNLTSSNNLVIKEDYLSRLAETEDVLHFFLKFDQGSDLLFKVNIVAEEVATQPELNPTEFDFYLDDTTNITSEITWNDATKITDISLEVPDNNYEIRNNSFYELSDDTLTIDRDIILTNDPKAGDIVKIKVSFDYGSPVYLQVNIKKEEINDPVQEPGEITVSGSLDIKHSFPASAVEPESLEGELWNLDEGIQSFQEDQAQELIVRFGTNLSKEEMIDLVQSNGYQVLDYLEELHSVLVKLPKGARLQSVRTELSGVPDIHTVTANKVVEIFDYMEPNDEYYNKQWAPSVLRLPQTWRDNEGSSQTRIAVIDTGIADNNLELTDFIDANSGYNFVDDNTNWVDGHNHGTHVAGIISAKANNNRGVVGVMWNSELIPVKVLDNSGSGSEWSVAQGILYAAGLLEDKPIIKADVINMSLGLHGDTPPELIKDAVHRADEAGVLMVAAAGNSGQANDVGWPAAFDEVIAVSALTYEQDGPPTLSSYSSYGPEVELSAPGTAIWSTITGNYISSMSGTSMAAPQVTGLAGLLISKGVAQNQVLSVMKETAFDLGDQGADNKYGHGMINTYWGTQQVSKIRVMIGNQEGNSFETVQETTVSLDAKEFTLQEVPAGKYEVMVWLDVRGNNVLEAGDYFATTEQVVLEEGNYNFDLELEEIF